MVLSNFRTDRQSCVLRNWNVCLFAFESDLHCHAEHGDYLRILLRNERLRLC